MNNVDWRSDDIALNETADTLKKSDPAQWWDLSEDFHETLHDKIMSRIELVPSKGSWFGWRKQRLWRAFTELYPVKKP